MNKVVVFLKRRNDKTGIVISEIIAKETNSPD